MSARIRMRVTLPIVGTVWACGKSQDEAIASFVEKYAWVFPDSQPPEEYRQNTVSKAPLLKDYAKNWHENYFSLKVGGRHAMNSRIMLENHAFPMLGDRHLDEITLADANQYMHSLSECSKSVVKQTLNALRMLFDYAMDENLLSENVFRHPRLLVKYRKPKKIKPIPKENVQEAIEKLSSLHLNEHIVFMLAIYTGMRIGEIFALEWQDVDLEKQEIHVRQTLSLDKDRKTIIKETKTDAGVRSIPIVPELYSYLLPMKNRSRFVINNGGTHYKYCGAQKMCRTLLTKLGLKGYGMHQLRHTFATQALPHVDIKTLQHIMGHSDPMVTLRTYTDDNPDAIENVRVSCANLYG